MSNPIDNEYVQDLLKRCAAGDEGGLKELHRVMARRIYAFAFHRARDENLAETVVVDTMYEVWKSASKFRGESLASTWILGIARFKLLNQLRKVDDDTEDIADYEETIASDAPGAEAMLMQWQQEKIVQACMDELSAAHKECVQLVYYEGLGLSDVATIQKVPENTVKTRLFHARKSLKSCVETSAGGRV